MKRPGLSIALGLALLAFSVAAALALEPRCVPRATYGGFLWQTQAGALVPTDSSYVTGIARDSSGNIYMAGRFTGTADFGGGTISSGVGYDVFVAKYTNAGAYVWAYHFNSLNVQSAANAISVDSSGNVIVAGSFFNTLDFGGACSPMTAFSRDFFVAKFSSGGVCVWSTHPVSSDNAESASSMAVDGSGNVVAVGGYQGTIDFGNSVTLTEASPTNASDIFLVKYNSSGVAQWARSWSGDTEQSVYDVAVDSLGNIASAGAFKGTIDLCSGGVSCPYTAVPNPISGAQWDGVVVKYNSSGVPQWAQRFGDAQGNEQQTQAVAFNSAGSVLATGFAGGTVNFAGTVKPGYGPKDLFVVKLAAADGVATWARRFGLATFEQYAYDIAVDADAVLVAGAIQGAVDFGGGPVTTPDGVTNRTNALELKLSSSGGYRWARSSGSTGFQSARAVAGHSGDAVFAGVFAGSISFGGADLASPGSTTDAIFMAKFGP